MRGAAAAAAGRSRSLRCPRKKLTRFGLHWIQKKTKVLGGIRTPVLSLACVGGGIRKHLLPAVEQRRQQGVCRWEEQQQGLHAAAAGARQARSALAVQARILYGPLLGNQVRRAQQEEGAGKGGRDAGGTESEQV